VAGASVCAAYKDFEFGDYTVAGTSACTKVSNFCNTSCWHQTDPEPLCFLTTPQTSVCTRNIARLCAQRFRISVAPVHWRSCWHQTDPEPLCFLTTPQTSVRTRNIARLCASLPIHANVPAWPFLAAAMGTPKLRMFSFVGSSKSSSS